MSCDAEQCRVIGGKSQPVHARIHFEVNGPRGVVMFKFTDQCFELFFGVNCGLQSVLEQSRKGVRRRVQDEDAAGDAVGAQFNSFLCAGNSHQGHAVKLQDPSDCCSMRPVTTRFDDADEVGSARAMGADVPPQLLQVVGQGF